MLPSFDVTNKEFVVELNDKAAELLFELSIKYIVLLLTYKDFQGLSGVPIVELLVCGFKLPFI